jgi:uncharacterized protein
MPLAPPSSQPLSEWSSPSAQADFDQLKDFLATLGKLVVAFSGGVDSSLLTAAAHDVLGENVLAVTACSATYPTAERERAISLAKQLGVRHSMIATTEMSDPRFRHNPPERCYFCKGELFGLLAKLAAEQKAMVVDGTNRDDSLDFRPGRKAAQENGVRSPFAELGFGKTEIRAMARHRGLPNWNLPACACLASRIPYGEEITPERLDRIAMAETAIKAAGFQQVRVRDHGIIARIEIAPEEFPRAISQEMRNRLSEACKKSGYRFVCLDIDGYRVGSMNELLPPDQLSPEASADPQTR